MGGEEEPGGWVSQAQNREAWVCLILIQRQSGKIQGEKRNKEQISHLGMQAQEFHND